MRSGTKAIIGFGSIWGVYAFGAVLIGSFTMGANDTAPEVIASVLYGLTIFPSCILAIWRLRAAAIWLIALAFLTAYGFAYQDIHQAIRGELGGSLAGKLITSVIESAIPGVIGILLYRSDERESAEPNLPAQFGKRER